MSPTEFQAVTPDAKVKTHFVVIDAVGVCERDKSDSRPLEQKPSVPIEKLLEGVALGVREPETLTSLAGRLIRLEKQLEPDVRADVEKLAGGKSLSQLAKNLLEAVDPDKIEAQAGRDAPPGRPLAASDLKSAAEKLAKEATAPLATNPELRQKIIQVHRVAEQTIDTISKDRLISAGADKKTADDLRQTTRSFRDYIDKHKIEIEALQILYSRPYAKRLSEPMLKELEKKLREENASWNEAQLWRAFESEAPEKVKGKSAVNRFADLVPLVRFALKQQPVLKPFADSVTERFHEWLMDKAKAGITFTSEQIAWLNLIRDHIATSVTIESEDLELAPFRQRGGLGRAHQLFGNGLPKLLDELNQVLAA